MKTEALSVVVIGSAEAGKSSIVSRYVTGDFSEEYSPTPLSSIQLTPIRHSKNFIELVTREVAGLDEYKIAVPTYLEGADVVIIVYDVTNRDAVREAKLWEVQFLETSHINNIYLVANKVDKHEDRVITREEGEELATQMNAHYFETSARTDSGISDLFSHITHVLLGIVSC